MIQTKSRLASQAKKQKILEVALQCFISHGVTGTTIEMIREASGMSVGSLYHHFGNKEKIAAAVYIEGMRRFGDLARQYLAQAKVKNESAKAGIDALVFANIDWISDNPDWARFVFQQRSVVAAADKEAELNADLKSFRQELIEWFIPYAQQGAFRAMPLEVFSAQITGPTHEYARHWLSGRYNIPLSKHRGMLAETAWRAVKAD